MAKGKLRCVAPVEMSLYENEYDINEIYDATLNFLGQIHIKGKSGKYKPIWLPFVQQSFELVEE